MLLHEEEAGNCLSWRENYRRLSNAKYHDVRDKSVPPLSSAVCNTLCNWYILSSI